MRKLLVSVYSGNGDIRTENQDSVLCRSGRIGTHTAGLFLVADGCGGMENGAQISGLIAEGFDRLWNGKLSRLLSERRVTAEQINQILDDELERMNAQAIKLCTDAGSKGGSTVSLLLIVDTKYYIKNIGDSRIYRVRHKIRQLTQDQTVTADMVRNGELTAEQAVHHKKRHILSMCIGYFERLRIFSAAGRICRNDHYIVCCDGFYNCIDDRDLTRFLRRCGSGSFENAAAQLRGTIPQGAAKDNVSVILVRCKGWYW